MNSLYNKYTQWTTFRRGIELPSINVVTILWSIPVIVLGWVSVRVTAIRAKVFFEVRSPTYRKCIRWRRVTAACRELSFRGRGGQTISILLKRQKQLPHERYLFATSSAKRMGEAAAFCTDRSRFTRADAVDSPRLGCLQGRTDIFTSRGRSMQDLLRSARGRLWSTCSAFCGAVLTFFVASLGRIVLTRSVRTVRCSPINDDVWYRCQFAARFRAARTRDEREYLFQSHSLPFPMVKLIHIPNPKFSLVLFPFPSHFHWLFPFIPDPIPVLLVSRSDNKWPVYKLNNAHIW